MIEQFIAEFGNLVDPVWWQSHALLVFNVIMIDVVLAGDNAIVVGLAASRVAPEHRAKVIFWGIAAAVIMRIGFAATTQQLLAIVGLTLAGGILLLWVCWKMYRQITTGNGHGEEESGGRFRATAPTPDYQIGFWAAVSQIAVADISMSLDNILAVAGAAKESTLVLVIGLVIAIVLMAVASHYIAKLLVRYPWITWIGLAIIVYVAFDMIFRGSHEVACKAYNIGCQESLWEWVLNGFR